MRACRTLCGVLGARLTGPVQRHLSVLSDPSVLSFLLVLLFQWQSSVFLIFFLSLAFFDCEICLLSFVCLSSYTQTLCCVGRTPEVNERTLPHRKLSTGTRQNLSGVDGKHKGVFDQWGQTKGERESFFVRACRNRRSSATLLAGSLPRTLLDCQQQTGVTRGLRMHRNDHTHEKKPTVRYNIEKIK